ncbi:OmpA family protein [Geomonas oryzisoli]|uniref:OmpA family protein n=1 Tax=Geomonas oryzisoli TaxID=2847992 RepID=A0ABX8J8G9_9BACT|nr:OmpA family protein [Geomonas oryzisoli]QWV93401.1 OmpA family protein [Geomonas oryzisoli]
MRREKQLRGALLLTALVSVGAMSGCAHYEVNSGRGNIPGYYIVADVQQADKAIEAARAEGKDKLCPAEFAQAEAAKNHAYDVLRACHTEEAIALAKDATAKAKALCPAKAPEPAPKPVEPPPPAPAPVAPTDQLTVTPSSVTKGDSVTLNWQSSNATNCVIEPGIGPVQPAGSMVVTPQDSVGYTLTCTGAGGSAKSTAKVDVAVPAPKPAPVVVVPPPEPAKLCKPTVINIKFDTNKSDIKAEYHDELKALADFLKEFPNAKGTIEGHTDSVGDKAANMKLSQRRADSVRNYLIKNFGIAPDRIKAVGYGPTKPVASNKTAAGKLQNRRIESNFSCD